MTIVNLALSSPQLSDLLAAIDNLQSGIRVGVRDQLGNIYRIDGVTYDTTRMAMVLQIDLTSPILLGAAPA